MTLNSIENIYNEYRNNAYKNNPDFTIDFYNNNSILLNNIKTFQNIEQLKLYVKLLWHYINAKFTKCHYKDIIELVDSKRPFIDNEIFRLGNIKIKDDWYYGLIFFSGMSSYHLNDFKMATPIFKELVNYDSKNDRYRIWLNYSKYGQRKWISWIIHIICVCTLAIVIFFDDFIPSTALKLWIVGLALFGLILSFGIDIYIKFSLRRSERK